MKSNATKKKRQHSASVWADLAKTTSFSVSELRVLQDHHATLYRFCVDPEAAEKEKLDANLREPVREGSVAATSTESGVPSREDTSLELSFEQYCHCLQALIKYGSATQQFEYLFQTYAMESERGISRAELFQLLQEHNYSRTNTKAAPSTNTSDGAVPASDARYFERLYTWLKKHVTVYDRTRCGYLPLLVALEMLQTHPEALHHLHFQVAPFLKKLSENNAHYRAKAQAAAIAM